MSDQQRGVILYGHGVDDVGEALRDLNPKYVLTNHAVVRPAHVPVVRCLHATEADAVRDAAPEVTWLVVYLYRPDFPGEHAREPLLWLNTSKVDPRMAARAIAQPGLVTWYEVIYPIQVTTVDGGPAADDYGNLAFTVPDGHRMVAHAVEEGGAVPDCLQDAQQILPSHDLWALACLRVSEVCQACRLRHA